MQRRTQCKRLQYMALQGAAMSIELLHIREPVVKTVWGVKPDTAPRVAIVATRRHGMASAWTFRLLCPSTKSTFPSPEGKSAVYCAQKSVKGKPVLDSLSTSSAQCSGSAVEEVIDTEEPVFVRLI